jgi:hypothetical protein
VVLGDRPRKPTELVDLTCWAACSGSPAGSTPPRAARP